MDWNIGQRSEGVRFEVYLNNKLVINLPKNEYKCQKCLIKNVLYVKMSKMSKNIFLQIMSNYHEDFTYLS